MGAAPTFFSLHVANAPALSLLTSLDLLQLISFIPFCLYFPPAWEGTEGDNRILTCKFQINVFSPNNLPPLARKVCFRCHFCLLMPRNVILKIPSHPLLVALD